MQIKDPFTQTIFVVQLNAIFVALSEVATKCDFITILVQFVSPVQNFSARLFRKQKLFACSKVKLLIKSPCFVSCISNSGDKLH